MMWILFLRRFWPLIAGVLAALALIWWHNAQVDAANAAGRREQAAIDATAYRAAADAAAAKQDATIEAAREVSDAISKDASHELTAKNDDLARRYDALRKLWSAHNADPGRAYGGSATGVPGSAGGAASEACSAIGGLDFADSVAVSEAADRNAAQVNAWIDWASEQARAWPKP